MDDLISRQAVIDEIEERKFANRTVIPVVSELNRLEGYILRLPSAQSAQPKPCDLCKKYGLEDGDTLYCSADWDGGIGFDYIRDIHYCPKCGRRLGNE